MDHQTTYDTLLSHNSRDKPAVEQLAVRLKAEGLSVWFDKWDLVPGEPWQKAIERALAASRSVAVFVGRDGLGPWHELEMRAALSQQVDAKRGFRVIPVLLPGATVATSANLPAFLKQLTWVQFQDTLDDANAWQRLLAGIRGEAPGYVPAASGSQWVEDSGKPIVPRGLRAFDERDRAFYLRLLPGARDRHGLPESIGFWKDALEQIDAERTFRVGLIFGPSGCGKSSSVRADLIPHLAEYVLAIHLDATPDATEQQLLQRLRKRLPGLRPHPGRPRTLHPGPGVVLRPCYRATGGCRRPRGLGANRLVRRYAARQTVDAPNAASAGRIRRRRTRLSARELRPADGQPRSPGASSGRDGSLERPVARSRHGYQRAPPRPRRIIADRRLRNTTRQVRAAVGDPGQRFADHHSRPVGRR